MSITSIRDDNDYLTIRIDDTTNLGKRTHDDSLLTVANTPLPFALPQPRWNFQRYPIREKAIPILEIFGAPNFANYQKMSSRLEDFLGVLRLPPL
ncbi:Hypothetical protein NTJ_10354 [Nesidiocoris tenuis]|uniref:Uncharacterized protein n=1 Tax=Nesidiocoris tenuis TaxID=355587 RepID=A0ABN7AZD8_9HEMI|nr:Hypothetical protein NTJ_10354 [Nesidiocoris tenuis]